MHHDPLTDPETVLHPADAASGRSACSTPSPAVASLVVVTGARCRRKPFPASSSLVGRIPAASPRPLRIAGRTSLSALEYPRCLSPCLDSRLHQLPAPEMWRVPDEVVICALAMLNFFRSRLRRLCGNLSWEEEGHVSMWLLLRRLDSPAVLTLLPGLTWAPRPSSSPSTLLDIRTA